VENVYIAYNFSYVVICLQKVIKLIEIWQNKFLTVFLRDIVKFSTFVFNKVVQWDEWGEVENVYIAYNFSYFVIYLPKIVKIDLNLTKLWQK